MLVSDRRWFYGWLDEHFFQYALKLFYRTCYLPTYSPAEDLCMGENDNPEE